MERRTFWEYARNIRELVIIIYSIRDKTRPGLYSFGIRRVEVGRSCEEEHPIIVLEKKLGVSEMSNLSWDCVRQ